MSRTAAKDERLHLRVDASAKQKLVDASAYQHQSLSDFVLAQALPAAERILNERRALTLSEADWNVFFDALVHPPAPSEALRRAFRRHREMNAESG